MTTPTDDQLAAAAQKARADHETAREIAARLLAPPDPVDILAGVIADRGEVADERDELQAKCDALTADLVAIRGIVGRHGAPIAEAVRQIRDELIRERDLARADRDAARESTSEASAIAETQRTAAADLRNALDRVADAAGVDSDSAATVVADLVVSVIKELRTETACHRISAAQMRRALERVAAAVGVEADADTDFIVERVERATSVIKELREELNRRVAAATSTPPTVDELLATAPVGSIIECERDEPGKFAQIKIVPGRIWRRRSWADGAWWSWGDVSVLEIDVLKRRACLVTAAEAAADPASRWSNGGGK